MGLSGTRRPDDSEWCTYYRSGMENGARPKESFDVPVTPIDEGILPVRLKHTFEVCHCCGVCYHRNV